MIPENKNVAEFIISIDNVEFTILHDIGFFNSLNPEPKLVLLHSHEYYELIYSSVKNGIATEDGEQVFEPNTIVITPPKKLHNRTLIGQAYKTSGVCGSINFAMKKLPNRTQLHLFEKLEFILSDICSVKANEKLGEIISRFDIDHPQSVFKDTLLMSLLFHELIAHIVSRAMTDPIPGVANTEQDHFSDSNTSRTYKINMLVYACYHQNITMEFVAKKLNISTRQLSRIIRSVHGCSFHEFITKFRMKEASQLLKNTAHSIAHIASEVGFSSSKGFENAFKKYHGVLPSHYRKQQAENS